MPLNNKPMNELSAFSETTVSVPTTDFQIGFEFKEGEHNLNITLDDDPLPLSYDATIISDTTVRITPAITEGKVRLMRETDIDENLHKFSSGALFEAAEMDANFEQIRHSQQETNARAAKVEERVIPLADGLESALEIAQESSDAAVAAANTVIGMQDKIEEIQSIKDRGAIGDGTLHPLSEWLVVGSKIYYPSLAAIQVDYPFVTSLTESIDRVALQGCIKALPLNTASTGILTPKGFANGGRIYVPRGRYVIDKKVDLQRGLVLEGESRESSQLISYVGNNSVLQYLDAGRYIQDEIVIKNLSIWQDASVVATTGAGIDVIDGPASVQSMTLIVDNVLIEGTYHGIRHMSGVGSAVRNCNISKTVLHGIFITGTASTTSTIFENTYCHICGGDGYRIEKGAYLNFSACASDSNNGYGYYINGANGFAFTSCGAEQNVQAGMYLKNTSGGTINLFTINNGAGVAQLDSTAGEVVFIGGSWTGTGIAIRHVVGASKVRLLGTYLVGDYITQTASSQVYLLNESSNVTGKLVGGANNRWSFGVVSTPDSESGLAVGGLGGTGTTIGFKATQSFNTAGVNRNSSVYAQAIVQDTAVTYSTLVGVFIGNSVKGTAATVQRTTGIYAQQQTLGTLANANILIDTGSLGTVPAGNWSIYDSSTRDSYFAGAHRLVGGMGLFGIAPVTSRRSITGKLAPTTQVETNVVLNSIVSTLVAYGLVTDNRTA